MTSQEAYKIMCEVCDKAEKYDKMINVLQEIRQEIEAEQDGWIEGLDSEWHAFRKALSIIDKHIKE